MGIVIFDEWLYIYYGVVDECVVVVSVEMKELFNELFKYVK